MGNIIFAHLRVLEDAYIKYQQGYLDESFIESRKNLAVAAILSSTQVRAEYEAEKRAGVFPQPFIDWFDEELRKAEALAD